MWLCDERGRVSYRRYDQERNALVKTIQDVNSAGLPSGVSLPAGWPDNVDALNIETDFTVDEMGRVTESLGPAHTIDQDGTALEVRTAAWTAYDEGGRRTIGSRGYKAVGTGQITVVNPVSVTQRDEFGQVTDERQVVRSAGLKNTLVSVSETFADQTGWCRWTHHELDAWGQVTGTRVYHDIPASGSGTEGPDANYNQSRFAHDWAGRQYKQTSPGGTITWTTFDGRGRATGVYVGNDDTGGTAADPTNGDSNHMRLVTSYEYDGGGAGDGNRTGITQHVDGNPANDRVTTFAFDSRNRAVRETPPPDDAGRVTYVQTTYDNLDRATRVEKYQVSSSGDMLLARSETDFDSRGQAWRTLVYPVSGGIAGSNALIGYTWHDAAGNAIKSAARRVEAVHEDGVRRCRPGHGYLRGLRSGPNRSRPPAPTRRPAAWRAMSSSSRRKPTSTPPATRSRAPRFARKHTSTATGVLDSTEARVTQVGYWFDGAGRQVGTANYGTGTLDRTAQTTVPARSDSVLVTTTEYNDCGEAFKTVDPAGREDRQVFDDAGRLTTTIDNYVDGNPATGGSDEDVTVERTYTADGQVATLTAKNPVTGDQTTRYVFGTEVGGITPLIYRNDLLRAVIYPDSDDPADLSGNGADGTYDRVEYKLQPSGRADRDEGPERNGPQLHLRQARPPLGGRGGLLRHGGRSGGSQDRPQLQRPRPGGTDHQLRWILERGEPSQARVQRLRPVDRRLAAARRPSHRRFAPRGVHVRRRHSRPHPSDRG